MQTAQKFYARISNLFLAHENYLKVNNNEWSYQFTDKINVLVNNFLPYGSGFDQGVTFSVNESNHNKLVFITSFHHMDENGFYCGWSDHKIIVTPDLTFGFNIKITGVNMRDIKDYISDCFHNINPAFNDYSDKK
jgi:hypothetical protein